MKKIAITLVLSTGLFGIIITACNCKDVRDYWKPTSLKASAGVDNNFDFIPYQESDTVHIDSLQVELNFGAIFHSSTSFLDPFYYGNFAYAMKKCPENGHQGVEHKVSDFKLTSNQDFDGIPAGNDLSEIVYIQDETNSMIKLEENENIIFERTRFIHSDDSWQSIHRISLKGKPANEALRTFEFEWTFTNGDKIKAKTQAVVW